MKKTNINHCTTYLIMLILLCSAICGCTFETVQSDSSIESSGSLQAEPTDILDETDAPAPVPTDSTEAFAEIDRTALFTNVDDVGLYDVDGQGQTYAFDYDGESFTAVYTYDNWTVIDSYRITNAEDIEIICRALAETHPIHSADMESYRTSRDMAYEWIQHNLAYRLLPDDSPWKQSVKDVDINPDDQGKSIYELYKNRIGDE